jgi:phosphoribosyl-ATP pyrophosphohydrolase
VILTRWFPVAVVALLLVGSSPALADSGKKPPKDSSFGALKSADAAEARSQAETWLKSVKADDATLKKFATIWDSDRPVIDKVASTLALGDPAAAKMLEEAKDADASAPIEVPAILKDKKKSDFYRNNLALAYGKALTLRKVYEEALEALSAVKAEDVVDPSALLFHKAVCEYELMLKDQADESISKLIVDVSDAPQRYLQVAALMAYDMQTWQEKDLGWIARKMDNIQRRLDLKRGGKQTQKMQKEVLVRLDEMIKEIENQQKGGGS